MDVWFTVRLLYPLAYPPTPEVRFCWTVISHKTGSVIFHAYTHYCAHVRLQLITASISEKILSWIPPHRIDGIRTRELSPSHFSELPSLVAEFCHNLSSRSLSETALWRLAIIFFVPCVALDFIVFTDTFLISGVFHNCAYTLRCNPSMFQSSLSCREINKVLR